MRNRRRQWSAAFLRPGSRDWIRGGWMEVDGDQGTVCGCVGVPRFDGDNARIFCIEIVLK